MSMPQNCFPVAPETLLPERFRRHEGGLVRPSERRLLSIVRRRPDVTRAEIGADMDLAQQSVHRLLGGLLDDGLIVFGRAAAGRRGQPSPSVRLNPRFACSLGVALSTSRVGISCSDFAGGQKMRSFEIDGDPVDDVLDRIDACFTELLEEMEFSRDDVLGIGFAIAGYVIADWRYSPPHTLSHWSKVEIAPRVSRRFGVPCWSENTSSAAALGEAMFGAGKQHDSLVYVDMSYGLGSGIYSDGRLMTGAYGNAGEIGGIFPDAVYHLRPAPGLLIEKLRRSGRHVAGLPDLGRAVAEEWPEVEDWLRRVQPQFDSMISAISGLIDPDCIVLGGDAPVNLASKLAERSTYFRRKRYGFARRLPDLILSQVGDDASCIGAAWLPLQDFAF
ncbi:ROK family protein [Mangrovicoccus sp. HB182678]|uniref:ROK family protein n=2 Tax=Mangrovicoccus algicola TaxID=2771008 RepID=A0A8J6YV07_9RHOB|nr:ROK family protein [Mangrovicoccus algicola]